MFITLDFSEVYAGLGLAVLAASVATPVQFRAALLPILFFFARKG